MFIAARLENNGIISIVKNLYRNNEKDKEYSQPPYNYTKVEVDDKYSDCINQDFNEDLTFNVEKYNARKQKEVNQKRIAEIKIWFEEYDNQVKQYQRCIRLGIDFDKDIIELDNQAKAYQEELRMYNDYVEQCKSEAKMGG